MASSEAFSDNEIGQPTKFVFGTGDVVNDDLALSLFNASEVGEWALERQERYPEYIEPKVMYVAPWGDEDLHHVAWVGHRATMPLLGDSELQVQFDTHHAVCDCVMHVPQDDRVKAVWGCSAVRGVLGARADEIGATYRSPQLLAVLSELDAEDMGFVPSLVGREIIELSVTTMLTIDQTRPQEWMANIKNGILVVSAITRALGVSRNVVLPVLDELQNRNLVVREKDLLRLGAAAFDADGEEHNPLLFVRIPEVEKRETPRLPAELEKKSSDYTADSE